MYVVQLFFHQKTVQSNHLKSNVAMTFMYIMLQISDHNCML